MRNKVNNIIYRFSRGLELILSLILSLMILIFMIKLCHEFFHPAFFQTANIEMFTLFLDELMTLAIGVELIKMLCVHSPGTIVEVLLFAIARAIIASHSSGLDTLIGVLCIVVLFATRKYLFLPHDTNDHHLE